MYALVDCNNFYVSCERVFQPRYDGKPVLVLSNNDGCAIARSEEAKALGIEMGAAVHLIPEIIEKNNVKIFSSNYTLYGDMSRRFYNVLRKHAARVENYSIDEAFLFLGDMGFHVLEKMCIAIRAEVKMVTGIPVTIGLAPTKTLAKLANRYAKKKHRDVGVYALDTPEKIEDVLRWAEVRDVCGIGSQNAKKLETIRVHTAHDFLQVPEEWVRKNMTVVGQRVFNELRGLPCVKFEEITPPKKGICTSRSFGKLLTEKKIIREAVASHAAKCAQKLRKQGSCAGTVRVFLETNSNRKQDAQFNQQITKQLMMATSSTNLIIVHCMEALDMLFQPGYNYNKAGVMMLDIVPESSIQKPLWGEEDRERNGKLMKVLDGINAHEGADAVRFAVQGYARQWKGRAEHLSKCYTTRLDHIVRVRY